MGVHGRGRGEADLLADLPHGGRVAVTVDVRHEELPDLLLACSEWCLGVGLIRRDPTKPRAIELTGHRRVEARPEFEAPRLPLLGRVAAGGPLLAEENVEDHVSVPEPLARGADFLLTVHGDSMIEAGILDGDTIVVQRRDDAHTGDVVVALVGDDESADEATVKTFHREPDGRVQLQPENAALEPIYADHVQVLGKVVGVFRSLR